MLSRTVTFPCTRSPNGRRSSHSPPLNPFSLTSSCVSIDVWTATCGTNACIIRFLGSSEPSNGKGCRPSAGVPPNIELDAIREGVPAPLGDADLEPVGVEVEANREETDALEPLYGRLAIDEAIDCGSCPRIFGNLIGEAILDYGGANSGAYPDSF